jgi:dTDP-3-amino-2,3,6-trideoxy-4-keto-D-glucose/dTDP-3-amino-3,4,6-trideoxy-alpha-D-glucose/dTDP-2,6-dideoxy-D-kanosamine transaminase
MSIKVWDYLDEYLDEKTEILSAVDRVFSSGTLILGNSVKAFEAEFAAYCGTPYGIGVDNATNGIFLALKALGIGKNDEVITVSNTAVPTVSAIAQAGATPRFVDVCEGSALMDVSKVEDAITDRTRCIIPVHLYGQCVDMTALVEIARRRNLRIIEDCSQSHGATHKCNKAGSMGDMGVFSFYPTKPLGGFGDGGFISTNSLEINIKLRSLRFYGMKGTYYAEELGYNSRLDEVHAEILRFKLTKLDSYIERRQRLARRYDEILAGTSLHLPTIQESNTHVYYVYVVRHALRDHLIDELKKKDILLNISYPWPIHMMRGYSYLGGQEGDLPVTERLAKEIFSLPMYPSLTEEMQNQVCLAIGELLGEKINL